MYISLDNDNDKVSGFNYMIWLVFSNYGVVGITYLFRS